MMRLTYIMALGILIMIGALTTPLINTQPNNQTNPAQTQASTAIHSPQEGSTTWNEYATPAPPCVPKGVENIPMCFLDGSQAFILFTPIKLVHKYVVLPGRGGADVGNTTYRNLDVARLEYLIKIDRILIYERLGGCHLAELGLGDLCDQLQDDMHPGNTIHVITNEYFLFPNGSPIPPQPNWDRYDFVLEVGRQYVGVIAVAPQHNHYLLLRPLMVIGGRVYSPSDLGLEKCYYVELKGMPLEELVPKLKAYVMRCWNEWQKHYVPVPRYPEGGVMRVYGGLAVIFFCLLLSIYLLLRIISRR